MHQFEDDEIRPILEGHVIDRHYVRVIQRRDRSGFRFETLPPAPICARILIRGRGEFEQLMA